MFSSSDIFISLAQAAPQQIGVMDALIQMLPVMLMVFAVYYFMYQKPMQREQDDHKKMVTSLIVGDTVITIGGIRGEVASIEENTLVLKTGTKSSITILKTSIRKKEKGA